MHRSQHHRQISNISFQYKRSLCPYPFSYIKNYSSTYSLVPTWGYTTCKQTWNRDYLRLNPRHVQKLPNSNQIIPDDFHPLGEIIVGKHAFPRRPFTECRAKKRPFSNAIEGQRGTGIALSARLGRDTHPFDLIGRNKSGDIGEHSLAGSGLARKYRGDV